MGIEFKGRLTDGLTAGKRWESEWKKDGEWIAVDLKHEFELTRVRLFWENAYATAFDIEVSANGDNWTQAASVSDGKGGRGRRRTRFRNSRALYTYA